MQEQTQHSESNGRPYLRLLIALVISYIVMFAIMFSRVNVLDNLYISLNQFYMTGLMIAPMLIIMLVVMGSMYHNKRLNAALSALGVGLIALFWVLLRNQVGVGDEQFLNSMIPHHSAAILVCENADLSDPRIQELCTEIIEAQEREISEMKALMEEY